MPENHGHNAHDRNILKEVAWNENCLFAQVNSSKVNQLIIVIISQSDEKPL